MRDVIAVCRSSKAAIARVSSVLDRYLWRIGDRTWRGKASTQCLERIAKDLKRIASKATAVAVYDATARARARKPLFVVGSRARFGTDGLCPVATARKPLAISDLTDEASFLDTVVGIAALFHDVGKATRAFQAKLRRSGPVADAVRHEVFSTSFWLALTSGEHGRALSDTAIVHLLSSDAPTLLQACENAWRTAQTECARIFGDAKRRAGRHKTPIANLQIADVSRPSLREAVALLVLTHHRLHGETLEDPEFEEPARPSLEFHLNLAAELSTAELDHHDGERLWENAAWQKYLSSLAHDLHAHVEEGRDIVGAYEWGRLALLLADHHGSAKKTARDDTAWAETLANTVDEGGVRRPADSLVMHTLAVARLARKGVRSLVRLRDALPSIASEDVPVALRIPDGKVPDRFAWQGSAARDVAASTARGGGLFAVALAGTGTGKTRGCPMVLAAASAADPIETRRGLRYTLGLGLRTLAHQSGREYVRDLGFASDDVAILVGGPRFDRDDLAEAVLETTGSEADRLDLDVEITPPLSLGLAEEDEDAWLFSLSSEVSDVLPAFFDMLLETLGDRDAATRLLATPVACATIDHVMPAADARRGRHALPMLRVMSADLVIDEIDLFEPEDLCAIGRLAYLCGSYGRRLVVASATVGAETVETLFAAYTKGWSTFARLTAGDSHVTFGVLADDPRLTRVERFDTNDVDHVSRSLDLFKRVTGALCERLAERMPLRRPRFPAMPAAATAASSREPFWALVFDEALSLAADNTIVLPVSDGGIETSVGLVRLANVGSVRDFCRWLAQSESAHERLARADTCVRIVCHHARMLWMSRFVQESFLARALDRKGPEGASGTRLLRNLERVGLDDWRRTCDAKRLLVLVVATPVIETGNDLDFDFAVIEPSSVRAIVQTVGRVHRHRSNAPLGHNVAILPTTVRGFDGSSPEVFAYPGVETPISAPHAPEAPRLGTRDFSDLCWPNREILPIDARLTLADDIGRLGAAERDLRRAFFSDELSPEHFARQATRRFSARFGDERRFRRRRNGLDVRVFRAFGSDGQVGEHWHVCMPDGRIDPLVVEREETLCTPLVAPVFRHDSSDLDALVEIARDEMKLSPDRLAMFTLGADLEYYRDRELRPRFDDWLGFE